MKRRALAALVAPAVLLALGCGSSDSSPAHGTSTGATSSSVDPTLDTDGDYLPDVDEAALGTDPDDPDTDGDGYLDGDEVLEQTDPLDPDSRIYIGGWPYQRLKDQIPDPGFDGTAEVGALVPRLVATDQFGEQLDLYDFALHGHRVVIDLSAVWCGPCKDMATWLEGQPSNLDDKPELAPIRDLVASGAIHWITIVFEDGVGNAAGPAQAAAWAAQFPNPKVAVVADDERAMYDFVYPGGMPSITVLDDDMSVRVYDRFDYMTGLTSLLP